MKLWSAVALVMFTTAAYGEPIFKYGGKTYDVKDLPPAMQQSHFQIELENFLKHEAFVDNAVIDLHVQETMKKSGKSREAVESDLFKVKEPSKKDVAAWYEANKSRLPPGYKLEQIEDNIKMVLKKEGEAHARKDLVETLRKKKGVSFLLKKPEAPQVEIKTAGYPRKGSAKAKVTIVEFADYQCPHCKAAGPEVAAAMKKFGDKVSLVFMDFPINRSGISTKVAHGGYCAMKQDKYWPYHELAFEKQRTLSDDSPTALAKELGLDEKAFKSCYEGEAAKKFVAFAKEEGERIGVDGTPAIFVNGRRVLTYEQEDLAEAIQAALDAASS